MNARRCLQCSEASRCKNNRTSLVYFFIGMIATVAIRVVNVAEHFDPVYGKIAWYIGICGFFVYFVYKFNVEQQRTHAIKKNLLLDKINKQEQLTHADRVILSDILCSLSSNRDMINYFIIFLTSAMALLLGIYLDFFMR